MKVTGPGTGHGVPPSEADGATDATKPAAADGVAGTTFADKLRGPDAAADAEASGPAAARQALERALDRMLDGVVDSQLGAGASPEVRDSLRAALRDTLENDPFLAEKLRALQEIPAGGRGSPDR